MIREEPPMPGSAALPDAPRWQGVNHLALSRPTWTLTVRFYAGVLGMRLVATTMAGPMGVTTSSRWRAATPSRSSRWPAPTPSQSPRAARATGSSSSTTSRSTCRRRGAAHGCAAAARRGLRGDDRGRPRVILHSIYFTDPNGIALEASYWTVDGTARPSDFDDPALFEDPDPVPAVAEAARRGVREWPETRPV